MFKRYAIFHTPHGAFADWGATWLGWDSAGGRAVPHGEVAGLDVAALTARPRKYGLHGTLKAPFRLADGATQADLRAAVAAFAKARPPVPIGPLSVVHQNGFVALRPAPPQPRLSDFASDTVRELDRFRAPLTEDDIARRRKSRLSPRQDAQMLEWGYPFVFEDFHFHLTLTGRVSADHAPPIIAHLSAALLPIVPAPYAVDTVSLMGEDAQGLFHLLDRFDLAG
ncbi:DUF1045 domain-containing protein [Sulfitobacter sp. HNIBRBA2951]|uniref:DUF1045 domain-containing protein n=1 Tax=Sulfitobacter aquimarinus TaxID=3158557 RepID=UPI0032E03775